MAAPPVDVVRRAIVRAFEIARAGESARPPVPAPAALRAVLHFKRLPLKAQATVAQVLDTDDEFRSRVAAEVDRDEVGRAAWLWLSRPEGWEDELAQVLDELDVETEPPERERDADKALRRRVEGAERAARRAEERAERAEADLARARQELSDLREAHDALDRHATELKEQVSALTAERRDAVAGLKRVETLLNRRNDEKRALSARVAELEAHVAAMSASMIAPTAPSESEQRIDVDAMRSLLDRIASSATELGTTVDDLRSMLGGQSPAAADDGRAPRDDKADKAAARRARRRAAPIPGGLVDDSEEAAAHLLSRTGAVLLVDGYNVSMSAWPDVDIAEQRMRLERILADVAARNPNLSVEVVFDGAEVLPLARTSARRVRGVTVRFTAPDVEADDELLEMVDRYPHSRVVIVASDDRRVRDGARRRGANVLRATQLLTAARA